jgi:8-oxo-dGTP diphosphatase
MSPLQVVGAAITQGHRCLVAQRGPHGSMAGKWEFPGGKVEPGESPAAAVAREIAEELGLQITIGPFLANGAATIGHHLISLDIYAATITPGTTTTVALREHAQFTWATADQLANFDWAEADVPCLASVSAWLRCLQLPP